MSAIPTFAFHDMDASHLDDKMDVASSPFRQLDDIDVELDSVRDPSVIEDEMIDYQADAEETGNDFMHDHPDETLPDDDMIDQSNSAEQDIDYNMDAVVEQSRDDEDEDILYEDEEDTQPTLQHVTDSIEETHGNQELESAIADGNHDVILDEFVEQTDSRDQDDLNANGAQADSTNRLTTTVSDVEEGPDSTSLEISEVNAQQLLQSESSAETQQTYKHPTQGHSGTEDRADETSFQPSEHQKASNEATAPETELFVPQGNTGPSSDLQRETAEVEHGQHDESNRDVHPVTLIYLDEEMSLFPPMLGDDSTVYFLSDASLVFEPLDKLLAACREVLTGTLDHHDELVLDVPGLGLHICEDSKYAAEITLSEVLEVYLNLCHNDANQDIQPLCCHLSSRVSLASQYAYLSSAGAEGKTYSEIAADLIDTPVQAAEEIEAADYSHEFAAGNKEEHQLEDEHRVEEHSTKPASATSVQGHRHSEETASENLGEDKEATDDASVESPTREAPVEVPEVETFADEAALPSQSEDHVREQFGDLESATLGHEEDAAPQVQAAIDQAAEDETNSSHTVEAYPDDEYAEELAGEAEGEDLFEHSNDNTGDHFAHDNNATQPSGDYEPYMDEELFAKDENEEDVKEQPPPAVEEESHCQHLPTAAGQRPSGDGLSPPDLDQLTESNGFPAAAVSGTKSSVVPSPPITPSKGKLHKRKVEEDDELDLLDISTPEPKRRRPS